MSEIVAEDYQKQLEEQVRALLDVIQSVALGDLDVTVEVPEGIEAISELAIGVEMMVDDLREMMIEQERARAEIEAGRQQLESALQEVLAAQQRYLHSEWAEYTAREEIASGYFRQEEEEGPTSDAWLPAMDEAVARGETVAAGDAQETASLAVPIKLYDEVFGAIGFRRKGGEPWDPELVAAAEAVVEQVGWALESQRLFDEEKQARALLDMRVEELDCLNDIGRKIDEGPPVHEFLQWVVQRIPTAMQFPSLAVVAISFNGDTYGQAEALTLPRQIVQGLRIAGEEVGRICIAYREPRDFLDEESALLGDISRRVAGYIENRRLFDQTQMALAETEEALAEAQALYDATRMVAALAGLDETLQAVVEGVARALPADQVALYALDMEQKEVTHFIGSTVQEDDPHTAGASRLPPVTHLSFDQLWDGLTGWVLREGEAALSPKGKPDPREGPEQQERRTRHQVGSLIVAPMRYGDEILGTLTAINHVDSPNFGQRDVDLMVAMGSQAAVALENARLFEEARSRARQEMVLNQVSQALAACQDVEGVLDQMYEGAKRLLGEGGYGASPADKLLTGFYITLYDPDSQEIAVALQVIDGEVQKPWTPVPRRGGLTEHLIQSRQPLRLSDRPTERLKEMGVAPLPLMADRTSASWLGVPITLGDQVLGTMVALDYERERAFDERTEELMVSLANRAALALQNVRLLAETRAALEEVEAAHRSYLRQGWQEYLRQQALLEQSAFVYDEASAHVEGARPGQREKGVPVPGFWRREMEQALAGSAQRTPSDTEPGGDSPPTDGSPSGLAVPISLRGQTFGVLGVEALPDGRQWTEEDRALIEAVSEQLAQTLESARLFSETQRRAERERIVGEITAKIRASTDIHDILETTAVELGRVLGTSRTLVKLTADEDAGDDDSAAGEPLAGGAGPMAKLLAGSQDAADGDTTTDEYSTGQSLLTGAPDGGAPEGGDNDE